MLETLFIAIPIRSVSTNINARNQERLIVPFIKGF